MSELTHTKSHHSHLTPATSCTTSRTHPLHLIGHKRSDGPAGADQLINPSPEHQERVELHVVAHVAPVALLAGHPVEPVDQFAQLVPAGAVKGGGGGGGKGAGAQWRLGEGEVNHEN